MERWILTLHLGTGGFSMTEPYGIKRNELMQPENKNSICCDIHSTAQLQEPVLCPNLLINNVFCFVFFQQNCWGLIEGDLCSFSIGGFSGGSAECLPGHARESVSDGGQMKCFEGFRCIRKDYVAWDGIVLLKKQGDTLTLAREIEREVVANDFCNQFILGYFE